MRQYAVVRPGSQHDIVNRSVFITGGTGYIGRRFIPLLSKRGHRVKALVRKGSESKLPIGTQRIIGDALQIDSYTEEVLGADIFIHLIGVPHPSPAKAKQFRDVDLVSTKVAVKAACDAAIRYFVYLSVAQPAPGARRWTISTMNDRAMDPQYRLRVAPLFFCQNPQVSPRSWRTALAASLMV